MSSCLTRSLQHMGWTGQVNHSNIGLFIFLLDQDVCHLLSFCSRCFGEFLAIFCYYFFKCALVIEMCNSSHSQNDRTVTLDRI